MVRVAYISRTRLRCTSSNRFSAAVFLSLLPTAGEFLPLPAGDSFLSSSAIAASSSFILSSSTDLEVSFDFDFEGFFLK